MRRECRKERKSYLVLDLLPLIEPIHFILELRVPLLQCLQVRLIRFQQLTTQHTAHSIQHTLAITVTNRFRTHRRKKAIDLPLASPSPPCQRRSTYRATHSTSHLQPHAASLSTTAPASSAQTPTPYPAARTNYDTTPHHHQLCNKEKRTKVPDTHQRFPTWIFNSFILIVTSLPVALCPFNVYVDDFECAFIVRRMTRLGVPRRPLSSISTKPPSVLSLTNWWSSVARPRTCT